MTSNPDPNLKIKLRCILCKATEVRPIPTGPVQPTCRVCAGPMIAVSVRMGSAGGGT